MDSTVLIVGAGPTGLFTALLLSQMGIDIRIIDKTKRNQELSQIPNYSLPLLLPLRSSTYHENTAYNNILTQHSSISLLSPRVLQLLKLIGLYEQILEHGEQHWKLQVLDNDNWYHDPLLSSVASHHSRTFKDNNGIGSQTYKLWENNSTEINFCVSIDRKRLCQLLETALIKRYGIQVDYGYELVNMYDQNEKSQVLYMEDESNTDFYQGGFDKNNAPSSSKDDGFTPIISALRHSEHHQNIQVWQSQYLIAADGKSSTVRQKLGLTQESGTTTKTNLTRKSTLSSLQRKPNQHQYFYSIIAKVKTNFNEKKQISIVVKPEGTLFILVHHDVFSMVFQPNNINPNESLSLLKTQLIIKRILRPYDFEFIETYNYFYWKDLTYPINKTNQVDYRYFLLGGTTLNAFPPGWVSSDIGLDQAMNLCWKLNLYHQEKSSPKLLDTYSSESYIKSKDITMASSLLLQILSTPSMLKDSITALQLFQKHRRYFVGEMVLDSTAQQFTSHSSSQTLKMARGTVGTLAPNALLKPYTLKQLKSQRSQDNRFNYHQLQSLNSLSSYYQDQQEQEQVQEKTKQQKLGFFRGILSFSKKQNHHQSSLLSKKKSSPSLLSQFSSTTSTTASLLSSTSLPSPMDDKWKSIRNNTTNLWQHLPLHKNQFRSHFTILIVCHSLYNQDMIDSLQRLNHYLLNDPTSFLQLFDPSTNYINQDDNNNNNNNSMNRYSSTTTATANQSLLSYYSTPPLQQQREYGPRKSMSTPTRTTTALEKEEEEENDNINNTIDIEGLGSSFLPPTLPPVIPLPPLPSTLATDSLFSPISSPKEKNKSSDHLLEQQQQRKNSITSFYSALTNINNEEQNDDENSEDDEDDMDMIKNMDININDDESAIINFDDEDNDDSDIENNNNSNGMLAIPNHPSNQKQRYSNGVSLKSYRSSTFTNTTSRFSSYSDAFSLATTLSTSGSTLQLGMDEMKHNSILPPPKCPLPPPPPPSAHSTTSLQQRQQQIPTSSTTSFHSSHFNNVYTHHEGQQNSYYSIAKKSMLSTNSSNLTMTTYNKNDDDKEEEEKKKKIPMFSFTYLTTSNKPECLQFLAEQTPNTIQNTFPFGLENVHMDHENQAHSIYSLDNYQPTMVVIRPDGYIGAKVPLDDVNALNNYFHQFLLPDMHFSPEESAISLVANGYI